MGLSSLRPGWLRLDKKTSEGFFAGTGSGDTGVAIPGSWLHNKSRLLLACSACNLCLKLRRMYKACQKTHLVPKARQSCGPCTAGKEKQASAEIAARDRAQTAAHLHLRLKLTAMTQVFSHPRVQQKQRQREAGPWNIGLSRTNQGKGADLIAIIKGSQRINHPNPSQQALWRLRCFVFYCTTLRRA